MAKRFQPGESVLVRHEQGVEIGVVDGRSVDPQQGAFYSVEFPDGTRSTWHESKVSDRRAFYRVERDDEIGVWRVVEHGHTARSTHEGDGSTLTVAVAPRRADAERAAGERNAEIGVSVIKLKVSEFQATECCVGLDIDTADRGVAGEWGYVDFADHALLVFDVAGAVYRLTSTRDIYRDNADYDDALVNGSRARSMGALLVKLVAAVGGYENVPESARRWL